MLDAEEALLIADEVCMGLADVPRLATHPARIRDLPAICAVAAVCSAHLGGVPVHASSVARARAIRDAVDRLEPLEPAAANRAYAEVLIAVLEQLG